MDISTDSLLEPLSPTLELNSALKTQSIDFEGANNQQNLPFSTLIESPTTSRFESDYTFDSNSDSNSDSYSTSSFEWNSQTQSPKSQKSRHSKGVTQPTTSPFSDNTSPSSSGQKQKVNTGCQRQTHAAVEERYRRALVAEMHHLHMAVPQLVEMTRSPTKATIISTAVQYIKSLEKERDALLKSRNRKRAKHMRKDD
jgi:hypothetical protein